MDVTTRHTCRVCDADDVAIILDYGEMPLAGGFLTCEEIGRDELFPLRLAHCRECGLLQVLDTVAPDKIFHHYSYTSSTTKTLSEHFARMGVELVRRADATDQLVVEFGCNDGVLLRPLRQAGARVVGVDPSDVALRASQEQGWPLIHDYFSQATARQVRDEYGLARVITGNNVFAHMDDLHEIMRGVNTLLEDDGLFVFEVHYQGDLLELVQYDTVYHEHTCYHSLRSLKRLLTRHGLKIVDVERIPIHAGSIRVSAAKSDAPWKPRPLVETMLAAEREWDVGQFSRRVEERRVSLQTLVRDLRQANKRVVAYGAAGRATILLNFCGLGSDVVEYVLDMSPLRYGRFVPGVQVPVLAPDVFHDTPPDYAIITAWNYTPEIVEKERAFLAGGGRFIVPLPEVQVIGAV